MVHLMKLRKVKRITAFLLAILMLPLMNAYGVTDPDGNKASFISARPWIGFGEKDNVYCGIDTEEKLVALTFDDGPHPRYTDVILDILKEYNVRATFFVVGENVDLYSNVLKRVFEEGHEIGNHTYTHSCLKSLSASDISDEMKRTELAVKSVIGDTAVQLFRPPEGCCNKNVVDSAVERGYKVILWTVDPRDWASSPVDTVVDNIMHNVNSGSIILCHDYNSNKHSPTPEAIRTVIPRLLSQGYRFVTVSELIKCND